MDVHIVGYRSHVIMNYNYVIIVIMIMSCFANVLGRLHYIVEIYISLFHSIYLVLLLVIVCLMFIGRGRFCFVLSFFFYIAVIVKGNVMLPSPKTQTSLCTLILVSFYCWYCFDVPFTPPPTPFSLSLPSFFLPCLV